MAQADYIGKQIQAMNLTEREVVAVMTQDSVWKGFATMVRGIKLILLVIPTR